MVLWANPSMQTTHVREEPTIRRFGSCLNKVAVLSSGDSSMSKIYSANADGVSIDVHLNREDVANQQAGVRGTPLIFVASVECQARDAATLGETRLARR